MKRALTTLCLHLLLAVAVVAQGKAKYVFYFIGDGMGVNQVNAAETWLAAMESRIGIEPLCFPSFPHSALVNTQSASNGVTDSAAGGTALATGHKTTNGFLGVLPDKTTAVTSLADWARDAGAAVGIATNVSIDHATPASFYAHVPDRGKAYDIGMQLVNSDNDFYAGSDFVQPESGDATQPSLYAAASSKGFDIARGYADYCAKAKNARRMILFQTEEASQKDPHSLPYALDRTKDDLTVTQITKAAIDFLTRKQDKKQGFMLMVEGGKIDWLCHANDLAFIHEVTDMDNAVRIAYDFYLQHPDETLIVVTADHETGGLSLGRSGYMLHLDTEGCQSMTIDRLGKQLHALRDSRGESYKWEDAEEFLKTNFGFWDRLTLTDEQTARLKESFSKVMDGTGGDIKTLYQNDDELASTVKSIISELALVNWGTTAHSNGYVPCFAIGAGAELFHGRIDNTEIPKRIAKAAGWQTR